MIGRIAAAVAVCAAVGTGELVRADQAVAARTCNHFDFDFDSGASSTLTLKWIDTLGRCVYQNSWRAGSGNGTTDPCAVNRGRLPSGWYDSPSGMTDHYPGTAIQGRVWRLQDKQCNNGTWRTELFIHTEETSSNGQDCDPNEPDDRWCWDDTRACASCALGTYDYYSQACIKVRRQSEEGSWGGDVGAAHDRYHDHIQTSHNAARSDLLYVHVT